MIDKEAVGMRIADIRTKLGYSQAEFAHMLGVSAQAVSKWETGLSLLSMETLLNISWMSHVSINEILDENKCTGGVPGADRGLAAMDGQLCCPRCGDRLRLEMEKGDRLFYRCGQEHQYDVIDGVVYFNTREIPGELWSLWLKNYDHYLEEQHHPGLARYAEGKVYYKEVMWEEIERLRPRTIVDIACGTGSGIKYIIQRIRWPVTILLTDLSHRILKYNRVFFSGEWKNPYVDLVYLACDCAHMPLPDGSVDLVFSNGGFESMQQKMMDGFREAYRILKPGGHAVYNIGVVDDHEGENTKKWVKLFLNLGEESHLDHFKPLDIREWTRRCERTGFTGNKSIKIYGEMPAPEGDVFPFENMIMRWMAQYVMVSRKPF